MPGAGRYRFVATRDEAGTYAMVYAPVGRPFAVRHEQDHRREGDGVVVQPAHRRRPPESARSTTPARATFTSPDPGEAIDWVLVLDDASKGYGAPGRR